METKLPAVLLFRSQFVTPKREGANSIIELIIQIKDMNVMYGRPKNAYKLLGHIFASYDVWLS
jgi:N-acetylglucosamine malate deacetylase 1